MTSVADICFSPDYITDRFDTGRTQSAESVYFDAAFPPLYLVSEIDGAFTITLRDGTQLSDQAEVRHFITHTPRGHQIMNTPQDEFQPYAVTDIDSLAQAEAWASRWVPDYGAASLQWIGASAGLSISRQRAIGQYWRNLDMARGCSGVTLDFDPEIPGRPQAFRPGTPMLKLIELGSESKHFRGEGTIGVIYYVPVTTWTSENVRYGKSGDPFVERNVLASGNDPTGYKAIVDTFMVATAETVDEWLSEAKQAIRILAGYEPLTDGDEDDLDNAAGDRLRQKLSELANS